MEPGFTGIGGRTCGVRLGRDCGVDWPTESAENSIMAGYQALAGWRRDAPLRARSVSRSVWERFPVGPSEGRVLAVFKRSCVLRFGGSNLLSLVLPEVGDGPLNAVVEGVSGDLAALEPDQPVWLLGTRLLAGPLEVTLDEAVIWEPCPNWEYLRTHRGVVAARLSALAAVALRQAPEGSLLVLLVQLSFAGQKPRLRSSHRRAMASDAQLAVAYRAALCLGAGWDGDPAQLRAGAAQLAGLGAGLTPAGDDFLAGLMLRAWLTHPAPRRFCHALLEVCASRTTTLSAAFLRAAAAGECSAAWHCLLAALERGTEQQLAAALREVLSYGHTSGADALAGFLWMDLQSREVKSLTG